MVKLKTLLASIYNKLQKYAERIRIESQLNIDVVYCSDIDQDVWIGRVYYKGSIVEETAHATHKEACKNCVAQSDLLINQKLNN